MADAGLLLPSPLAAEPREEEDVRDEGRDKDGDDAVKGEELKEEESRRILGRILLRIAFVCDKEEDWARSEGEVVGLVEPPPEPPPDSASSREGRASGFICPAFSMR